MVKRRILSIGRAGGCGRALCALLLLVASPLPRSRALVLLAAIAAGSWSRPDALPAQSQVTFAYLVTEPRGEAGRHIDTFNGPYLSFLHDAGPSRRFAIGATAMGGTYGAADRPVPLPAYDARTQNSMVAVMSVIQFRARTGALQPYVQGSAGAAWFETSTTLWCDGCGTGSQGTDHSDATFVWGGSGGVLLRVYERKAAAPVFGIAPDQEPLAIYLDLGARYLRGGTVRYLPGDPVFADDGTITEELVESRFRAFQYQVGVSARF